MATEVSVIIVLTDLTLYFVLHDSILPSHTFAQAPVPILLCSHPLHTLSQCVIFFGFQRCVLQFEGEWEGGESNVEGWRDEEKEEGKEEEGFR